MDDEIIKRFDKIEERLAKLELMIAEKRKNKTKFLGVVQYLVNFAIIAIGAFIAYSNVELGVAAMAIGASLLFNQFNNEDTEDIKSSLKDIKDQLDRIEKK